MPERNFRERFEAGVATANEALSDIATQLPDTVPGLTLTKIRRLLRQIARLLEEVESGRVKFPEYLATLDGSAPELAIQLVQQIPSTVANGPGFFIANSLSKLNDVQVRLAHSLGTNARTVRSTRDRQLIELQATLEASQQTLASIQMLRRRSGDESKKVDGAIQKIATGRQQAEQDSATIKAIRDTAQKLASGDARRGDSLEKFIRTAREKNDQLAALASSAEEYSANSKTAEERARKARQDAEAALTRMAEAEKRADEILRGATQVGLAGAYKTERDRLSREQMIFAGVFYFINIAIVAYAAVWIVPVLSRALEQAKDGPSTVESALMLLVRTVILAPALAALVFTARRHAKLETLQMDYAAKANTALAYSGYRDELGNDPKLSSKLRDGLVVRFLEHPERLLSRATATEEVDLGPDGVSYKSISASPSEEGE